MPSTDRVTQGGKRAFARAITDRKFAISRIAQGRQRWVCRIVCGDPFQPIGRFSKDGHFIDRAYIKKSHAESLPGLLRTVPGFRLDVGSTGNLVRSERSSSGCAPSTYINGSMVDAEVGGARSRRFAFQAVSIFDSVPLDMVEAIEVYTPATVPAEFNQGRSDCGVVVIWLRAERR